MPLPSVGFSLQSLDPRRGRVPLSGSLAPLQFVTVVAEVRCARPILRVSPTPAPSRGGLDPHRSSCAVSCAANRAVLDALSLAHRTHLGPAAPPASKPSSPHEAVLATSGLPGAPRPMLSWASPLQSLPPVEPRTLHDPASFPATSLAGPRRTRPPRASTASREGATLARQVRPLRPHGRVDLVGAPTRGATADRTVPPLGGSPASLDLRVASASMRRPEASHQRPAARGPRRCEGLDQRPTSVR